MPTEVVKRRRHHNNDGRRQIQNGKTVEQVDRMAADLGLLCEIRPDGGGVFCCSEFVGELEDPETDGPESNKRFTWERCRVLDWDNGGTRLEECPFCGAKIQLYQD